MTKDELSRRAAITRLANATQYAIPENGDGEQRARDAWFRMHLDALADFSTPTVVAVCRWFETHAADGWFPKLPVLCEQMRAYARMQADRRKPVLALPPGDRPVDPAKWKEFRRLVDAKLARMRMK